MGSPPGTPFASYVKKKKCAAARSRNAPPRAPRPAPPLAAPSPPLPGAPPPAAAASVACAPQPRISDEEHWGRPACVRLGAGQRGQGGAAAEGWVL